MVNVSLYRQTEKCPLEALVNFFFTILAIFLVFLFSSTLFRPTQKKKTNMRNSWEFGCKSKSKNKSKSKSKYFFWGFTLFFCCASRA